MLEQLHALAADVVEVEDTRGLVRNELAELRLPLHKGEVAEVDTIQPPSARTGPISL